MLDVNKLEGIPENVVRVSIYPSNLHSFGLSHLPQLLGIKEPNIKVVKTCMCWEILVHS